MKTKQLAFLLSLTFLFLFSYGGACDSKGIHLDNNNKFSNFDVEGLDRDDSRHFLERIKTASSMTV